MKNRFCFLVVLALLLLSGCSPEGASADSDFFLWSDAYVAMEEGVPYTYSFTYYCEDPGAYLDPERVDGFYIPGLPSPEVLLSSWEFHDAEHLGWGLTLDFAFPQQEVYEITSLGFYLDDGTTVEYPVGNLVFDVGPPADETTPEEIYYWVSTVATSNSGTYPYHYEIGEGVKLLEIAYWKDISEADEDGLPASGGLPLSIWSEAPIKMVRPRLEIQVGTERKTVYANLCWCGTLSFDDADLEASRAYTASMRGETA